ncbi:MAG: hypothetical protein WC500_06305, partial [Candidatus Margulisiibacteriota bacterium]
RNPEELAQLSTIAIVLSLAAYGIIYSYYKPPKITDFNSWYILEIKDGFNWLLGLKINVNYQ